MQSIISCSKALDASKNNVTVHRGASDSALLLTLCALQITILLITSTTFHVIVLAQEELLKYLGLM